jgi:hypothetical protein
MILGGTTPKEIGRKALDKAAPLGKVALLEIKRLKSSRPSPFGALYKAWGHIKIRRTPRAKAAD